MDSPIHQHPITQEPQSHRGTPERYAMDIQTSPLTKMNLSEKSNGQTSDARDIPNERSKADDTQPTDDASKTTPIVLGGQTEVSAYALLTGIYEDTTQSTETKISVPLTTFPAILGRSQSTKNEHVFDLGNCKQLSRQHAVIFYADAYGGRLGKWKDTEPDDIQTEDNWVYKLPKSKTELNWIKKKGSEVPKEGFYAIECLSKNKVYVDGNRVEQGKMAILFHGSTIKMLTYTLYFLLPEDAQKHSRLITVPNPMVSPDVDMDESSTGPPLKKVKKEKVEQEPEELPLPELIKEFLDAIDTDKFERKHSMMSTSILQYAVHDVAKDASIRNASQSEGGVPRSIIMDWISNNDTYSKYVAALLTKVEIKSYQQNLSRALIKGGFTRLGTTGRHVKWILPENVAAPNETSHDHDGVDDEADDKLLEHGDDGSLDKGDFQRNITSTTSMDGEESVAESHDPQHADEQEQDRKSVV